MNPYIHATDITRISSCPRLAWLSHEHAESIQPYANSNENFSSLWKQYLGFHDLPEGRVGDTNEFSISALKEHGAGIHLRFEAEGVRTQIPILVAMNHLHQYPRIFEVFQKEHGNRTGTIWLARSRNEPGADGGPSEPGSNYSGFYAAIYPHMSKNPGAYDHELIAINDEIAKKSGIDIIHHQSLFLNADYIREDPQSQNLEELLRLSAYCFKKPKTMYRQNIDTMVAKEAARMNFPELIMQARELFYGELPQPQKCAVCSGPRHCSFFDECFHTGDKADDDPAFLFSSRKKKRIAEDEIAHLKDLGPGHLDGFSLQYAQAMAARNQAEHQSPFGVYKDESGIAAWIDTLEYPLIYLDFEWDTYALPPYPGMMPFDVLCFQYSMHIEKEDGTLEHVNFFEGGDCRRDFIESLISAIPETGSILVYNMEGAEKLRLMQLARQFPEYEEKLEAIWTRMVDLSAIFEHGLYYDLRQRGHFSLKSVLPLFDPKEGYSALSVQDGLQAIAAYRAHEACDDEEKKKRIAAAISDYCAMDTMAEVIILHGLKPEPKGV